MSNCLKCSKKLSKLSNSFYSNKCQFDYTYIKYIQLWKAGYVDGSRGKNTKNFSGHVIRYIVNKYNNKCAKCGWNKKNIYANKVFLEIDHIDGNSENNSENNLILLCPNCHSLTSSYKNLNFGRGRLWRRKKV